MSNIFNDFDGAKWETFCEIMIRHHYQQPYFTSVPAKDRGDCGLEFFTADGSIFQCYFPDPNYSMAEYKKHVQNKIRTDLQKLDTYKNEINGFLDEIIIKQWVLLIPENKTKDLITYCNRQKKSIIEKNIPYIDNDNFSVKIETADSYPSSKHYALTYGNQKINLPIKPLDQISLDEMKDTIFDKNIQRKSKIISPKPDSFSKAMIKKYLVIESYLSELRFNYPDIFQQVDECGRILLEQMQDLIDIECMDPNIDFIKKVKEQNEKKINDMFNSMISSLVLTELPYGYIAKWIAECNMDFEI